MSQTFDGAAIARATGGALVRDAAAGALFTDSRKVIPGGWFVALVGEKFDGHGFAADVLAKGAAGVVVSRPVDVSGGVVLVADTTVAYQALGAAARDRVKGPVIGIGGAAGKTTTRALTALALSPKGRVHQNSANLNNHIGVPLTLLETPDDAAAVVVEMGTSGKGEMEVLVAVARPNVRLVVNIGPEHLEGLGDLDGVAAEEGVMFDRARPGDVLLVNADDPYLRDWPVPAGARVVTWGESPDAQVRLVDAVLDPVTLATRATFHTPMGPVVADIPSPGRHVAHDAAGALAAAWVCGVDLADAASALSRYEAVGMRLRRESIPIDGPRPGSVTVLNDAYNANPPSMEAALAVLCALPGRRVAVLGDMLELGDEEAKWHDHVAAVAATKGLDLVVLCGPRMSAAGAACPGAWRVPDPLAVAAKLRPWLKDGDVLLVKGSRGVRLERVIETLRGT